MPVFRYQAVDNSGRSTDGVMTAHDELNLEEKLKLVGCWLVSATQERAPSALEKATDTRKGWLTAWGRVKRKELIDFCTLMSFQTKVGIPLLQALEVASRDCEDLRFRRVLHGLQKHIESGLLLFEALEKYPRIFSPHFVSVVRAGELSSKLPETFHDLKAYLEWVEQIIADVRQASLYPSIVLTVVVAFVLFLFTYIIPKFIALIESVHAQVPLVTRIIFGVSDFTRSTWWIWGLGLLFFAVGIPVGCRLSKRFALWVDGIKMRLPVFGELNHMLAISRFSHNLAILYRSGIPILNSLNLCEGLVGSPLVSKAVAAVQEAVKSGSTMSEALHRQAIFPAMLLRMVAMGENTGRLDEALQNVSDYYNDLIPRRIKKVFTILEPALTLVLIFIVGMVALSIFLPILTLMSSVGQGGGR